MVRACDKWYFAKLGLSLEPRPSPHSRKYRTKVKCEGTPGFEANLGYYGLRLRLL